jgi:hypothetical protein
MMLYDAGSSGVVNPISGNYWLNTMYGYSETGGIPGVTSPFVSQVVADSVKNSLPQFPSVSPNNQNGGLAIIGLFIVGALLLVKIIFD